jgi:2-amino-4-hydroxy-6-hydroxymethyldihydropteridine diphosphokinase
MKYLLSIGSNIGCGITNLKKALSLLEEKEVFVDECSSIYCSSPVDYLSQADFLNVSVIAETEYAPDELLKKLKEVEDEMGRAKIIEKGPRNIDLDIVFWEKGAHRSKNLTIPHKDATKRLFVIFPTLEIIENSEHFEEDKITLQTALEEKKELFTGQRIEKLCPLIMENVTYGWKDR